METGNKILILICVFLLILLGFFIVFTAAEEMTKKRYEDCYECMHNITLIEHCNQFNESNEPHECLHLGWCITLEHIKQSSK